jgi:hypothetical protein
MPEPGWLSRQLAALEREAAFWPRWMRRGDDMAEIPEASRRALAAVDAEFERLKDRRAALVAAIRRGEATPAWLVRPPEPIRHPEDVARIVAACRAAGYEIDDETAQWAYSEWCEDTACASWLSMSAPGPDGDRWLADLVRSVCVEAAP